MVVQVSPYFVSAFHSLGVVVHYHAAIGWITLLEDGRTISFFLRVASALFRWLSYHPGLRIDVDIDHRLLLNGDMWLKLLKS